MGEAREGPGMTHDRHFIPDEHPDHDATDPDCWCDDCQDLQRDQDAELAEDGRRDDRVW